MSTIPLRRPLVLASASPRRADLLRQIGLDFIVLPSHVDEPPPRAGEDVLKWGRHAAADKAWGTAALVGSDPAVILGADTVVVMPATASNAPMLHGQPVEVLGKPRDVAEAQRMLVALAGREHTVISAFALLAHPQGTIITEAVETRVRFRALSVEEIDAYIASGEPMDKAGAYGIQGMGAILVEGIIGDYYTVVGLPLAHVWQALAPWRE